MKKEYMPFKNYPSPPKFFQWPTPWLSDRTACNKQVLIDNSNDGLCELPWPIDDLNLTAGFGKGEFVLFTHHHQETSKRIAPYMY